LEAMSMEKPVVVGAAGTSGMREIVSITGSDQCGFHINPNDPADIAWGITSAVEDSEKRVQFGRNGRKRVLELFSWDAAAKSTIERYSELLKPKKSQDSSA
jgi:glycosyltransferase involved in cell wall biosynthesis